MSKKDKHEKKEHKEKKDKKEKKSKHSKKSHKHDKHDKSSTYTSKPYEVKEVGERPILTEGDYFLRSDEFRVWLKIAKNCSFESLQSSEAHAHFASFIQQWNSGLLLPMYYTGIPPELKDSCLKTTHRWNFQLTDSEKSQVMDVADDVERKTNRKFENAWQHMAGPSTAPATGVKRSYDVSEDILAREEQYENRKRQAHKERERVSVVLDEIAPKETGREALIDKRRAAGEKIRGAARDAQEGRDGLDVSESVTMGGGDDFASMKAKRDEARRNREAAKQDRINEERRSEATRFHEQIRH